MLRTVKTRTWRESFQRRCLLMIFRDIVFMPYKLRACVIARIAGFIGAPAMPRIEPDKPEGEFSFAFLYLVLLYFSKDSIVIWIPTRPERVGTLLNLNLVLCSERHCSIRSKIRLKLANLKKMIMRLRKKTITKYKICVRNSNNLN